MSCTNATHFTASDLYCAYHQVLLTTKTQELLSYNIKEGQGSTLINLDSAVSGDDFNVSAEWWLSTLKLWLKNFCIIYLVDSLLKSHTKAEMLTSIPEF